MKALLDPKSKVKKRSVEILLAEDNPADVLLMKEALKQSRFPIRLTVVENGGEALAYLRQQEPYHTVPSPDLILLDWNLPVKTGLEVMADIKGSFSFSGIPTLVLTGSRDENDKRKAHQVGVDAYLVKPQLWSHYLDLLKHLEDNWIKAIPLERPYS
jgi:chemotaxis family two-component system response regulator Rcp1